MDPHRGEWSILGELSALLELLSFIIIPEESESGRSSSRWTVYPSRTSSPVRVMGEVGMDDVECDEWVTTDDDDDGSSSLRCNLGEDDDDRRVNRLRGGEPNPIVSASVPLLAVSPLCSSRCSRDELPLLLVVGSETSAKEAYFSQLP